MRRVMLLAALLTAPVLALAQPAPPVPPVEMVLLPRQLAEAAAQWIAVPNAGTAVQIYQAMLACMTANPSGGVTRRMGPDQCPAVTEALAAQAKKSAAKNATSPADAPKQ